MKRCFCLGAFFGFWNAGIAAQCFPYATGLGSKKETCCPVHHMLERYPQREFTGTVWLYSVFKKTKSRCTLLYYINISFPVSIWSTFNDTVISTYNINMIDRFMRGTIFSDNMRLWEGGGKKSFLQGGILPENNFLTFRICCGMSSMTEGLLMLGFVYLAVPVSQIPLANHWTPVRNTCTYLKL